MKKLLVLLIALFVAFPAYAAETKPVETAFLKYWEAYAKQDYAAAADLIRPSEIATLKDTLLPVFLEAQDSEKPEVQKMVEAFFGPVKGKDRDAMSGRDVFVALNRMITTFTPGFADAVAQASVRVTDVQFSGPDSAMVELELEIRGQKMSDKQSMIKAGGVWWPRLKEDPRDTAKKLRSVFSG